MNRKRIISTVILVLALLFVYAPVLILAVYSFTDAYQFGMNAGFSFDNYICLFSTEELRKMIFATLALAVCSAGAATVLGTLGAMGAFFSGRRIQAAYSGINRLPAINADVVTGFSLCILLIVVFRMSKDSFIPLFAGHVTLCAPFVFLSVFLTLGQMDKSLYEAALDLGADPVTALRKIVIPELLPGILAGFVMAVALSLNDYFVAAFTKPASFDTISTYVVNAARGSQTEIKTALWALSTIMFIVVLALALAGNKGVNRDQETVKGAEGSL